MTDPQPPTPGAFQIGEALAPYPCPYRQACLGREIIRWVAVIVLASLTSWATGCCMRLRAPGFDFDSRPVYPTSQSATLPA